MKRKFLLVVMLLSSGMLLFGCEKEASNIQTAEYQVDEVNEVVEDTETLEPQTEEPNGNKLRYELSKQFCYDGDGKLSSTIVREYDDRGYVIKETVTLIDADGSENSYWYDEGCDDNGNLIKDNYMTDEGLAQYWTYKYDEYNNEIECITYDSDGNKMYTQTSIYEYDSESRITKETVIQDQEGLDLVMEYTYNYTYDEMGNLQTSIDNFGGKKIYEYDENGFLTRLINQVGGNEMITRYTNDEYGNAIKEEYYNSCGELSNYNENEYIGF